MRLTKWVKVDLIIENYKKDYPDRWASFVNEMEALKNQEMDKEAKFRLSAKFPAYPDERDISGEIMKIMPNFITSDYHWNKFKKKYPIFFR